MLGGASVLGAPLVYRNQSLSVLSGVLPHEELKRRLADADAAVIMKLGRNFPKVRQVLEELGLAERALYVERATMANQKIVPLDQVEPMSSPYFSLIIVPWRTVARLMTQSTPAIVILGQGSLATARRIQQVYPAAQIHGLAGRVEGADLHVSGIRRDRARAVSAGHADHCPVRGRHCHPHARAAAAGEGRRAAVLAVAEDGSAVVPLLGGLGGVNVMAREIAAGAASRSGDHHQRRIAFWHVPAQPAERLRAGRSGTGQAFVSDLLAGHSVRIEGAAPWLDQAQLPEDPQAQRSIHVGSAEREACANELLDLSAQCAVAVSAEVADLPNRPRGVAASASCVQALACLLASRDRNGLDESA
jgi:hypothetical protein